MIKHGIFVLIYLLIHFEYSQSQNENEARDFSSEPSCKISNSTRCLPIITEERTLGGLTVDLTGTDIAFTLKNDDADIVLSGNMGTRLPEIAGQPMECTDAEICWRWPGLAQLTVEKIDICYQVTWQVFGLRTARDCIDIGASAWYGGPEEIVQHFPLRKQNNRSTVPYVPGDMLQNPVVYFGGVVEPYWLTSRGVAVFVPEESPLFYSWNEEEDNALCLSTKYSAPYVEVDEDDLTLKYQLCSAGDPVSMQEYAAGHLWSPPTSLPDPLMMTHPIWSSWAQYKADINQSVILDFAQQIVDRGFSNSQLEIDDNWESCYGDATFDTEKFPDAKEMVQSLKDLGFRVTLWIHPFINTECASYLGAALGPNGYLVRDTGHIGAGPIGASSDRIMPGLTWWWQGNLAGYLDFTNPSAVDWWTHRLKKLRAETGVDSFKFDAGESNWLPSSYCLNSSLARSSWPGVFTTKYVEAAAQFGAMPEVRVGRRSQQFPVFVRMLDKASVWGYDNGLKTMVTTLLQFGIVGYPFVLPDMIGGNGYVSAPSKELYIRWLQVNVFMPAMQISYVPWNYGEDVVEYTLAMTKLHAQYAPTIIELANQAVESGRPINRPIWWLDPSDSTALACDSEFLLGSTVLVAPVLEEGATTRDIYLPKGVWRDETTGHQLEGPLWLKQFPAPLFTLPYFTRLE